jgi:Zn finger protein HypA/HybF involved in hydrogenase expression
MNQPGSSASAQVFPCQSCGGQMGYDAASQGMACPHCGQKQGVAVTGGGGAIRTIPLEQGMQLAQKGLGAQVQTVKCDDCGATVNVGQGELTAKCAFCGSSKVISQATDDSAIRPESLVPFGITKQAANDGFAKWLGGLWFRPNDLTKLGKVQDMGGVYVPYWSFDSGVQSSWTAERGFYYYVNENVQETDAEGRTVWIEKQVQKTRWEYATGRRQDYYKDVLVCAGRGLPEDIVKRFASFDMSKLVVYDPHFLAGWKAESYALELMPGWQKGEEIIVSSQHRRCEQDVGGDTQRGLSIANVYSQRAFKHVLLPIWISAFRYKNKVYRFLVNGQTGEIVGEAPWSIPKIASLIVLIAAIIGAIIFVVHTQQSTRSAPLPAHAAPAGGRHGH